MKHNGLYVAFLMMLVSLTTFAQNYPAQTDSLRLEKYKTEIGLDMSVPDFEIKTIDAKVMGERLANLLLFLQETYTQSTYERRLTTIIGEQNEKLSLIPLHIKTLKLIKVSKHGGVLTIKYNVQLKKIGRI